MGYWIGRGNGGEYFSQVGQQNYKLGRRRMSNDQVVVEGFLGLVYYMFIDNLGIKLS